MSNLKNDALYERLATKATQKLPTRWNPAEKSGIYADVDLFGDLVNWWSMQHFMYSLNREYGKAEAILRMHMAVETPENSTLQANLAAYLGRQGRIPEALEAAKKAIEYIGRIPQWEALHKLTANLTYATWLAANNQTEEAAKHFKTCTIPSKVYLSTFHQLRAEYFAVTGDTSALQNELRLALLNDYVDSDFWPDGHNQAVLERDILYDPYRAGEWFIVIVGETAG